MRILHFSDLHASPAKISDQRLLIDAFLADVRRVHRARPIDLVVFSGDLSQSGKSEEFALAREALLAPLSEAVGIAAADIVIAYGNHDVDRSVIDEFGEVGLRERLVTRDAVNALLDNEQQRQMHTARLAAANAFLVDHYGRPVDDLVGLGHVHRATVAGRSVGVAVLNSAWRAGGDDDQRRLLVGDRQTKAAVEAVAGCDVRVAVLHHPLEWLAAFDEDDLRRDLEANFRLVLTGHTHRADPQQIVSPRGDTIYSRAGALYEHRDYFNGYSVIDLANDGACTVMLRTYWPERSCFDEATGVAADGRVSFPAPAAAASLAAASTAVEVPYNSVLGGLLELLQGGSVIGDYLSQVQPTEVNDLLVAPKLLPMPYRMAIALDDDKAQVRRLAESELTGNSLVIVSGEAETGVTSTLLWLLRARYETDNERIPVYLRFNDIGPGRDPIPPAVRRALSRLGHVLGPKDPLPPIVLSVDDVVENQPKMLGRLVNFISSHPANVYVVGCHGDPRFVVDALREAGLASQLAFVAPFGRRELRGLIKKIGPAVPAPHLADNILGVLVRENLPRTPFMMAVLVAVLCADGGDHGALTEAGVLERYVRLVLEQWDPDDHTRQLDYRNFEHILCSLAEHLVTEKKRRLTRREAEQFVADYFEIRGWGDSAGHVVDTLVRRRVLVDDEDGVAFRHHALLDLFAAKRMIESETFAKRVLADVFRFDAPIRHAAAIRRDDIELLRAVGTAAKRSFTAAAELFDAGVFDEMRAGDSGWAEKLDLEELAELVRFAPFDEATLEDEIDDYWDRFEASQTTRADHSSPGIPAVEATDDLPAEVSPEAMAFPTAIVLLSRVLCRSDLVDDVALKTELLSGALDAWARLGVAMAAYNHQTGRSTHLVEYLLEDVPEDERAGLGILLEMFCVLEVAAGTLGTPKLVKALESLLADADFTRPTARALFATIVYCELRGPQWPAKLERLAHAHGEHPIVAETIRVLARWWYVYRSPTKGEAAVLERVVVDIVLKAAKVPNASYGKTKSRLLDELRKARTEALRHADQAGASYLTRDVGEVEGG